MISGQAPERRQPGRLPALRQPRPRHDRRRWAGAGHRLRVSGRRADDRRPADRARAELARLRWRTWAPTRRVSPRCAAIRPSAPATTPSRPPPPTSTPPAMTRSSTSTRSSMTRRCATPTSSASTPCSQDLPERSDDAQLLVHHPGPVQRRPRCAVQERPAGRPGLGRRVPAQLGAEDHRLAGVPAERAADRHLRRGGDDDASSCCGEIPGPGSPLPGHHRARRRRHRRGAAVALHHARHGLDDGLQPLHDAGQRRGPVRPAAPRVCGAAR